MNRPVALFTCIQLVIAAQWTAHPPAARTAQRTSITLLRRLHLTIATLRLRTAQVTEKAHRAREIPLRKSKLGLNRTLKRLSKPTHRVNSNQAHKVSENISIRASTHKVQQELNTEARLRPARFRTGRIKNGLGNRA
jgi:hypothetical protein